MFSPSLLSMMWHSLRDGMSASSSEPSILDFTTTEEVLKEFDRQINAQTSMLLVRPQVPVVGRGRNPEAYEQLKEFAVITRRPGGWDAFIYGRVPVDLLVSHFRSHRDDPSGVEFMDLGTPLVAEAPLPTTLLATCKSRMTYTDINPSVHVAFIDRGSDAKGPPEDFGGKLRHAVGGSIELSPHAIEVLGVLLDRLHASHNILDSCQLHCALVPEPKSPVGLRCFEHDNCVELLSSITALDAHLNAAVAGAGWPVVANLSMGTHVGPHDGNSPVEDFIRAHFDVKAGRHLHVAAGNDGMRGIGARRVVEATVDEHLRLGIGPTGSSEILVEFWWDAGAGAGLSIEAEVFQHGASLTVRPITISSGSVSGVTLTTAGSAGALICKSLFHANCHGSRSCIAFGLTAATKASLRDVDIDFVLISNTDVVVNAWLVVCDDKRSAFVAGNADGSVRVPACDPAVVGVAGCTATGQPWAQSARGPAADYGVAGVLQTPYLAHRVHSSASMKDQGTSFASPRACADAANLFVNWAAGPFSDAEDLAKAILNASPHGPWKAWSPRRGFGAISS